MTREYPERCLFCGQFLKQTWYLASDEPNDWQDVWVCSQDDKHMRDYPKAYGRDE